MRTPEQIAAEVMGNAPDGLELVMSYAELRATIVAAIEADRAQRPAGLEGTERIIHYWSRKHGDCEECSDPAAYLVLDAYGDGKHMLTCSVCAAWNAAQGQELRRIEEE